MKVTVDSIAHAELDAARAASDEFSQAGSEWREHADSARDRVAWESAGQWTGSAAEAAMHRASASINRWDVLGASASSIGLISHAHVQLLRALQLVVNVALSSARASLLSVSPAGHVTSPLPAWTPGLGMAALILARSLTGVLTSALGTVRMLDARAASAVHAMTSVTDDLPALNSFSTPPPSSIPPVPTTRLFGAGELPEINRIDTPHGPIYVAGDLNSAESITTFVSGVHSGSVESMRTTHQWALAEVERARAEGRNIAVATWHAYPAPSSLLGAMSSAPAKSAAPNLQAFQNSLRKNNPRAHLNVMGFSYGSVVVGQAAAADGDGLSADKVTFLGSPGVSADSAADLRLNSSGKPIIRSEHVPGDLIQLATGPVWGIHGLDPSSPGFGASPPLGSTGPQSWSEYSWEELMDLYVMSRGETGAHSSYLWDPSVDLTSDEK